ncbi:hypothetical protein ACOSQ2_028197 [Xanthoceras sorbifolium]
MKIDEESGATVQQYNDDYLAWKKIDQLLVGWLMSTLSESVLGRVTQCVTACEVWLTVTNMFSQSSMARIMHLRAQLQGMKKGSMKVSDYIVKIKGITDSLMAAGQVITEQDLVEYILGGLGLEFDPVVVNLTSKKEEINLQDAQFLIMNYESRLEQYHATATIDITSASSNLSKVNKGEPSANFARGGGQFQNNRGRSRGRRGGRGGRYYNQRLTCQLCGKPGHFSAICYHRFDQSFSGGFGKQTSQFQQPMSPGVQNMQGNFAQQFDYASGYQYPHSPGMNAFVAAPTSGGDSSWYVDSGATNHITPDFNNLSLNTEYKGQNFEENTAPRGIGGWSLPTQSSKGF